MTLAGRSWRAGRVIAVPSQHRATYREVHLHALGTYAAFVGMAIAAQMPAEAAERRVLCTAGAVG